MSGHVPYLGLPRTSSLLAERSVRNWTIGKLLRGDSGSLTHTYTHIHTHTDTNLIPRPFFSSHKLGMRHQLDTLTYWHILPPASILIALEVIP